MSYQVIARKWRPQNFSSLIGQEHIATTLLNALKNNRTPHALLFTGPRGTGKTSTARILAKILRCSQVKDFMPCEQCSDCLEIISGQSSDVQEIDGASNNGVDAVRVLREGVAYLPMRGRYKIYIIDEVHMLSTAAFNALLKTLEEPPENVVFILATTEVQKIPATILGRCQRFDFRRIPTREIAAHLEKICRSEGVSFQAEAIWLIARQAEGSMRDSQSLLDQVISYSDGELSIARIIEILGLTDRGLLMDALTALLGRNKVQAIQIIDRIFRSGVDAKIFLQELIEEIRHVLMVKVCPEPSMVVDVADSELAALRTLGQSLSEEEIHLLFDMAVKGAQDMLRAQDPRLLLEMLILKMAAAPRVVDLQKLLQNLGSVGESPTVSKTIPTETQKPLGAGSIPPGSGLGRVQAGTTPPPLKNYAPTQTALPPEAATPAATGDSWSQFVDKVKRSHGLLGAMLENTHEVSRDSQNLTIGIPAKMSFLFDKLKETENLKRIEKFLETFENLRVKVEVKLADKQSAKLTPKQKVEKQEQIEKKSVEQLVSDHPLMQAVQRQFKVQIKSIKEVSK